MAVRLTHASLDTLFPRWRTEAVVILERGQVRACSPLAEQAGVRVGLRASGVNVLCPTAALIEYDPHAQARARDDAALALLQYTPEVALADADTVLLDVTASLSLFRGIRALCRRVGATVQGLGLSARLSVAPTAGGAWLLATASGARRRRTLKFFTLAKRLDALPCISMPAAARHLDWLTGIGCDTLAGLRRLPRAALQRRTHTQLLRELDAAYGEAPELHAWVVAPPVFAGRIELQERIEHAQGVLFIGRRLVELLCGWLVAHHQAATRIVLSIEHERGRHACAPTDLDIRLAEPSWTPARMMPLLTERLGRLSLPQPAIAVVLQAADLQTMAPAPTDLFPEPGASASDRAHVLALLVARLGRENVLQASPVADHRPEVANRWVPIDETAAPARYAQGATRPCWLLQTPIALITRDHRPFYGAPLRIVQGPERIEDGWWIGLAGGGLTVRDYFVGEGPDGARYWLFRERGTASGWFLHGLFG
ncbi:Protein ImuB [Achromobacter pestifer]|uniref:Protein ImuB n=2 Tax=Achromobacter pestifer TaxID=1353889 RepID=A0A6S6YVR8_9BURK|nr:Protein ImuB [Achromobacter pestifer]